MTIKKCSSAVITIYLSLTLILTSALIFTLIESARVSSMKASLRSVTYMAEDSLFSEYAEPVFDRYGVMLLWEDEEGFLKKFNDHCDTNLSYDEVSGIIYTDLYRESLTSSRLTETKSPTDDGGQVFADQVYEYMNTFLAEDAAEKILDNVSIFDEGDKVNAFMDKIEEYGDVFKKVEESVSTVKESIDQLKDLAKDPSSLLNDASSGIDKVINGDSSGASDFSKALSKLRSTKNELKDGLEKIKDATDTYYENVEKAKDAAGELENELEESKAEYDSDVYGIISEQVEDIKQKSADTDFDYYLVGANEDTTDDYINRLDSLDDLFENTSDEVTSENAAEYKTIIESYKDDFSDFNLDTLNVNLDTSEVEKEDSSFLSAVSDFFDAGILGFVAGDVSEKTTDKRDLPSATSMESSDSTEKEDLISAGTDKALFSEYILQHFSNAADTLEDTALDYETEYIISGKSSDKDNLSSIVSDIVLLRTGCNLISILKSTEKKAETYALAISLAGFTGMPIIIKVFQLLIMSAWALAESICDCKALIEGRKIKTIKDDSDWYMSLSGIKNFGDEAISPEGSGQGLSYESYLRLLLLMQNKKTQYFRTMDMIQANMCLNENNSFRMADCYCEVTVEASYSAPLLFLTLPFVNNVVDSTDGKFSFTITQHYSY